MRLTKKRDIKLRTSLVLTVACIVFIFYLTAPFVAASIIVTNQLISSTPSGSHSSGNSQYSLLSDDGNYAAFDSASTDLTSTTDANGTTVDVYSRNLQTNITRLVSKSTLGVQADNSSTAGAISETGRFIVYDSQATNLIDGETNGPIRQVYLFDTSTETTEMVSRNSAGIVGDGNSTAVSVSNDGRFIMFKSDAKNLVTGFPPSAAFGQFFIKDRQAGMFKHISVSNSGSIADTGTSTFGGGMSCDGSFATFISSGTNLVVGDTNALPDVFFVDLRNGFSIERISPTGAAEPRQVSISCSGNYVIFKGKPNTISGITPDKNLYLYNRLVKDLELVNQSTSGSLGGYESSISGPYGRRAVSNLGQVVFTTKSDFGGPPSTTNIKAYIRDTKEGTTELVSIDPSGALPNSHVGSPVVTLDGEKVTYTTTATNLISGDTVANAEIILARIE